MASVFPGTIFVIKARNQRSDETSANTNTVCPKAGSMNFQHGMHPDELQYPSPEFDGVRPLRCCVVVISDDVNTTSSGFRQS